MPIPLSKKGRGQEAEGRRQKAGGINLFPLCQTGLKPLNLFMKNMEICISRYKAQEILRPY
jgi:hypothetical protein